MQEIAAAQVRQLEDDIGWLRREIRRQGLIPPPLPSGLSHVDKPREPRAVGEVQAYRRR